MMTVDLSPPEVSLLLSGLRRVMRDSEYELDRMQAARLADFLEDSLEEYFDRED